jgi:hypothetical protein
MVSKKSGRKTFTTAERKALSIRMKAWHAKKKYNKNQAKIKFPDVPKELEQAMCQTLAVDLNLLREMNYRRGLVTAMECILRELR